MTTSDPRLEPLSSLLVPTDFSKGAEAALGCALLLPLAQGAKIHILHVLPPNLPAKARPKAKADAKRQARFQGARRDAGSKCRGNV